MCTQDEMFLLESLLPRYATAITDTGYATEQDGFLGYSAMRRCKGFLIEQLSEYLHIGQDDLIYAEKFISGQGLCNIIYRKVSTDDDIATAVAFIADLYSRPLPPA